MKREKKRSLSAPKNLDEAIEMIQSIGALERWRELAALALEEKIEKLKRNFLEKTAQERKKIREFADDIAAYAAEHRKELTNSGKRKSIQTLAGAIGWRMTPPKTIIRNEKKLKARIKRMGLERQLLRIVEHIDREKLRRYPRLAKKVGVILEQAEQFFIKPANVQAEISKIEGRRVQIISSGKKKG